LGKIAKQQHFELVKAFGNVNKEKNHHEFLQNSSTENVREKSK
jgi:hypothetical protein